MSRERAYVARVRENGQWKHISRHRSFSAAIRVALRRGSPDGWIADVIPADGGSLSDADRAVWERARANWKDAQF